MFGSARKKVPDATEAALLRKKQIETLKSFNQVVKEIQKDTIFEVPVQGTPVTLSIVLPTGFPNTAPTIYVSPPLSHPWVDPQMVVTGHPKLSDWNAHASLGKVVKEIGKEIKSTPPRMLPQNPGQAMPQQNSASSLASSGSNPSLNSTSSSSIPVPAPAPVPISMPAPMPTPQASYMPQYTQNGHFGGQDTRSQARLSFYSRNEVKPQDTIPELTKLSNQELEDLLNNDEKFEQFLQKLDRLRTTETIVKELREENERVAASILEQEPVLKRVQEDYEAQMAILKVHQSELEANSLKLSEVMKKYSPQVIISKLEAETRRNEQACEDIWSAFSAGEMEHPEFVKQFIEMRKSQHKKAAKLEMVQTDPSILSRVG